MAGKYLAYSEYKVSGSEWIGKVPTHWLVSKLKFYANQIVDGAHFTPTYVDEGVPFLRVTDVQSTFIDRSNIKFIPRAEHDELIKRCKPKRGDILLSKNGSIGIPKIVDWDWEFSVFVSLCLIKLKSTLDVRFVSYFFKSSEIKGQIYGQIKQSTVINLHLDKIENIELALPLLEEQEIISNFLDYETAKIDILIEKQQYLIKLLKEKRQAVISHAVTKGLNPSAPMRDSGVEWLGIVPEHWVVTRAKNLFDFVTSGSRGWAEYYSENGSLFFRIANLTRDTIEPKLESIQFVSPPMESVGLRAKIKKEDLLISITADLGSVCVADDGIAGGYVSQHVSLCRPNKQVVSSRWLAYCILSDLAKEQLLGAGYGGTKIQLSLEDVRELWLVQPGSTEQTEIADFIDTKLIKFSKLMSRADDQILLLQERLTTLISAAVTGKVDVRDWQSPDSPKPSVA